MTETIAEKRNRLERSIQAAVEIRGIWQGTTCPTGEYSGWDVGEHYALEQIQRNPPQGLHVSRIYKFECYDWTVVAK